MSNSKTSFTVAVVFLCFSLISLFAGYALPKIFTNKLESKIQQDHALTRETGRVWGEVPGLRKNEYTKTFSFFDLDTTTDDFLEGKVNVAKTINATYDYSYGYKNLQFAPASGNSIQFQKAYNHVYKGKSEDDLKNLKIKTLNIGAFKGISQQAGLTRSQVFIQSLFKIYTSFQDDILNLLVTDYVSFFYISNHTLTHDTIFRYKDLLTEEQADTLWHDNDFGWSKVASLTSWVSLASGYFDNDSYDPASNPIYSTLKMHFGFTDAQMLGLASKSSLLYTIILSIQSTLSSSHGCAASNFCNAVELFALQFFSAAITKKPLFDGIDAHNSIADLNKTFAFPPEMAVVMKDKEVVFDTNLANNLFAISQDRNSPAKTTQTLFKAQNVDVILNNQDNLKAIFDYFKLDNEDQAKVLVDYVNYIVDQFAYQGKESLKNYKYTSDAVASSMNRLSQDIATLLTVNVTAQGTYTASQKQGLDCAKFLADIEATEEIIDKICNNVDVSLDSAIGQAPWVRAFIIGSASDAWNYIVKTTGLEEDDVKTLLSADSQLGGVFTTVTKAISESVKCPQTPCETSYVARLQWATQEFTLHLPGEYFENTYKSIVEIFPEYFGEFIPEPSVMASKILGKELDLTFEQAEAFFSFDLGSINNNFEVLHLISLNQDKKFDEIKARYGLDEDALNIFLAYFDHTFVEYYLGGLIVSKNAYDLLWGYEDQFLKRINNSNYFENMQLFDPKISLVGDKSNLNKYNNEVVTMINSGFGDSTKLKTITSYNGNQSLSYLKTTFDGNNYNFQFKSPWVGDLEHISGTDGSGFQTLMNDVSDVAVFEDRFLRNIKYSFSKNEKVGKDKFDFTTFQFDQSQLKKSERYTNNWDGYMNLTELKSTPLMVSLPYFKGCDATSYAKVTFEGKNPSTLQEKVNVGEYVAETLTGVTVSSLKNYQYNMYNVVPYMLTKTLKPAAVPIITVSENFKTPESNFKPDLYDYQESTEVANLSMIIAFALGTVLLLISLASFKVSSNRAKQEKAGSVRGNVNQSLQGDSNIQYNRIEDRA